MLQILPESMRSRRPRGISCVPDVHGTHQDPSRAPGRGFVQELPKFYLLIYNSPSSLSKPKAECTRP